MSTRHPQSGMLCGCFFLEKRRAEETCPARKGDGRIGTGTCLCLLFCRRGKDQSAAVYPSITDALQWAGWIWRGTAVWDKGNSRPQKGWFRQQAEYIVWGSNGPMPINRPVSCLPGVFRYGNPQNRIHVTEKPLQLMKDVIQICEPGGLILDPFAGAGTTILAATESGYQAVGIEVTDAYYKLGSDRVRIALEALEEAENEESQ